MDDEQSVCDCIRLLLAFDGHEVTSVNSGRAALSVFEKNKFDLVFTDYSMPGMRGDELAVAIKELAPGQPVLMITGFAPPRLLPDGVDCVLSKPFMLTDLREAIHRLSPGRSFAE